MQSGSRSVEDPTEPATPSNTVVTVTRTAPRLGPAFVVLGVVAVVVIGGIALALLGGNSNAPTPSSGSTSTGAIKAASARSALRRISTSGLLPADIVNALVIPSGSVVIGSSNNARGVSTYDETVTLRAANSAKDLDTFYEKALSRLGWTDISTTSASNSGHEIFARHVSSDGYYWEVGVLVTPANPSISPALSGDSVDDEATVALRIFEVDDEE